MRTRVWAGAHAGVGAQVEAGGIGREGQVPVSDVEKGMQGLETRARRPSGRTLQESGEQWEVTSQVDAEEVPERELGGWEGVREKGVQKGAPDLDKS